MKVHVSEVYPGSSYWKQSKWWNKRPPDLRQLVRACWQLDVVSCLFDDDLRSSLPDRLTSPHTPTLPHRKGRIKGILTPDPALTTAHPRRTCPSKGLERFMHVKASDF